MDEIDRELLRLGSYRNFLGYASEAFEDGRASGDPMNYRGQPAFLQSRRFDIFNTFCKERGRAIILYSALPLLPIFAVLKFLLSGEPASPSTSGAGESSELARFLVFSAYFAVTGLLAWRIGTRTALRKLRSRMKEDLSDE